jgi:membrane-associated phospholipid phosphatase
MRRPWYSRLLGQALGAALASSLSIASPASAQEPGDKEDERELVWPGRRQEWYDYAYTGALVAGAAVMNFLPPGDQEGETRHAGGILFDEPLRDAIVLGDESDRHAVATAADIALGALVVYPMILDSTVVAWGVHGSADAAWQMTMINLQSFAFTTLVTGVTKRVADRERPVATECHTNPAYDDDCDSADNHYSFPSGHASLAFTGAALICVHHFQLDLYGGGAADVVTCATGVMTAAFTGISRMISDKHYASDVIAGATIGSVSGALMPWLLYYGFGPVTAVTETSIVMPVVSDQSAGLSWTGAF